MRTKALLLTAALGLVGAASSMAQVYSVNAVGYVNKTFNVLPGTAPTFALLANPLNGTNNLISTILPTVPEFSQAYRWVDLVNGFESDTYFGGSWLGNTMQLPPGKGFFLAVDPSTPSPVTVTFVGEVLQGSLTNTIAPNYDLVGSKVPQTGGVQTVLGLNPGDFDEVLKWDFPNQTYATWLYFGGGAWLGPDNAEPVIAVGEGFFYNTTVQNNWIRTFTVN